MSGVDGETFRVPHLEEDASAIGEWLGTNSTLASLNLSNNNENVPCRISQNKI